MKKLLLLIIFPLIISCNKSEDKNRDSTKLSEERFRWDYPDKNATVKVFNTSSKIDDKDLISKLNEDFEKEKFKIEDVEIIKENSYSNCKENQILKLKGDGIIRYYIKRQEEKPKNYYPDFFIWIYEFDNEKETIMVEKEILKALDSGNGFCNGKSPEYIVRYKNKILHLGTRAEMFRGYIKSYVEKIEKLNK